MHGLGPLLLCTLSCGRGLTADLRQLRCPLESWSLPGGVGEKPQRRRLWPTVLELLELGLGVLFREKEAAKARRLFADALDLAQGRWDHGVSVAASPEAAELLLAGGFPAGPSFSPAAPSSAGLARAFSECQLGVAAAYRALSLAHLADANARESATAWAKAQAVAQRFQHLGGGWLIALVNGAAREDETYIDLSAWPITGEEVETEKRSVAHALRDLGGASSPARPGVGRSVRIPGLSLAIVTVCAYPKGSLLPHFASSVHRVYAERHGYTYLHHSDEDGRLSAGRPKAWAKVRALHEAVEAGRFDWVLWADCDIYFMDLDTTLDSLLLRYASRASAVDAGQGALDPNVHLVANEDAQSLNTAIFLMRTSTWSLELLRSVWGVEGTSWASSASFDWAAVPSPFLKHPWWEQASFTQQLLGTNHRRFQEMPYPDVDAKQGALLVPYPEQVRIAPQREMNSYHPISSRLEGETWAPGKFVLSFNGVSSLTSSNVARVLVANYYEVFCKLNSLRERCAAGLRALVQQQDWPQVQLGFDPVDAAMFAPWLLQSPPAPQINT